MADVLELSLSSAGFMPHGMCYLWQPGILTLHVLSDALITLAYFSIPFTLLYFVRRRTDLQFNWMFVCFAVFIVACGATHFMEIVTIWYPAYWVSGTLKAITALASVPTAILLVKLIPTALRVPSPAALRNANAALAREVAERKRAEDEVRSMNAELEVRVADRTLKLEAVNQSLRQEMRDRQRAEEILRDSEDRFRTLTESLPHLVWTARADGSWDYLSRQWLEYTGRTGQEQLGAGWLEQVHAADRERARNEWAGTVARGDSLDTELRIRRYDGVHRWFRARAVPLRDRTGGISKWFGSSTDIEDYKLAEQRQRTQLERMDLLDRTTRAIGDRQDPRRVLQVILRHLENDLQIDFGCVCLQEAAPASLVIACVESRSRPLATQLGLAEQSRIDIEGNGLARCLRGQLVYEPDLRASVTDFSQRLAQGGLGCMVIAPLIVESKIFGLLVAARREPGRFNSGDCEFLRQLSEHAALAIHQAELYSALQRSYEDLRETQQRVMQQERLRALGQMASGIAHDINNALSPAALYSQSLLEHDAGLSPVSRDYLVAIQRAIEDVAHTVARMREFYRRSDVERAPVSMDLNRVSRQVIELTRARWSSMPQERGIVIQMQAQLAPDLPAVAGEESEIRDALTNLILNAVDAMPQGGTLTVRTRAAESAGVEVEVVDTGIGMDETTLNRCLEPFFSTKGERGTGLGLAMVYGAVERHGGDLQIESEPGAGTLVRLTFPALEAHGANGTDEAHARPGRPLRLLFVDDDPLMLKSLRDTLEQEGHRVTVAEGGQQGIDTFRQAAARGEHFDAVITDLGMPHVDGRAVATAIKSVSPDMPVILLTGWGHRLLAENDTPEGVDRVLSKPPKLAALRLALAELTAAAGVVR